MRETEKNLNKGKLEAWTKGFFREGKIKGAYKQTLQNMRVSDIEDHFRYMIT